MPHSRHLAGVLIAAGAAVAAIAVIAHAEPKAADDARVDAKAVIELFTSQGCSSCPPADKLIAQYANDPSVIALSLAVDYWDYLGWKDTLALAGHTHRQQAYARVRGDREVYTPQVVVDGVSHAPGSDEAAIEHAIATSRQRGAMILPIGLAVSADKIVVDVPEGATSGTSAEVWLCPVTGSVAVGVERGENRGHTLAYHNVVRRWMKLGTWSGKAERFTLPIADVTGGPMADKAISRVAVLVQNVGAQGPGVILGAALRSLR